jgi:thiosulfate/3-mercaptopyruvate sulfurtransferase
MNNTIKEISTDELISLLDKTETKIIDIRPIEAYNGWCLQNEPRCGHIKGTKSLPAKWIEYIDWIEIVRSKKILPQHKIVIYGYSSAESEKVAKAFLKAGYMVFAPTARQKSRQPGTAHFMTCLFSKV